MDSLEGESNESSRSTIAGEFLRILFRMRQLKKVLFQNEEGVAVEGEGEVGLIVLRVVKDPKQRVEQKPLITVVHAVRLVKPEARPAVLDAPPRRKRLQSLSMRKYHTVKRGPMKHLQLVVKSEDDDVDVAVGDDKMPRLIPLLRMSKAASSI